MELNNLGITKHWVILSILTFADSWDFVGGSRFVPLTSHLIARRLDAILVDISHSVEAVISENRFNLMVFHIQHRSVIG